MSLELILYLMGGCFCLSAILLMVAAFLYFVKDIGGAAKLLKTEEAKRVLKDARTKRQAKEIVEKFAESGEDILTLEESDFTDILFSEPEPQWPPKIMDVFYGDSVGQILRRYLRRKAETNKSVGILIYAKEDLYEFQ